MVLGVHSVLDDVLVFEHGCATDVRIGGMSEASTRDEDGRDAESAEVRHVSLR